MNAIEYPPPVRRVGSISSYLPMLDFCILPGLGQSTGKPRVKNPDLNFPPLGTPTYRRTAHAHYHMTSVYFPVFVEKLALADSGLQSPLIPSSCLVFFKKGGQPLGCLPESMTRVISGGYLVS